MRRVARVSLKILLALLMVGLVFGAIRLVNSLRYPRVSVAIENPADLSAYSAPDGVSMSQLDGDYLRGFHLRPDAVTHPGVVFIWGGSDGGCNFSLASKLAQDGYEVLALFFFGQPGQNRTLQRVPLEFFGEALAYSQDNAASASPVTVIGASKGAELALILPTYFPQIDNVVAFTPTEYVWAGLDFSGTPASSWTWQGEDLPFLDFSKAPPKVTLRMLASMALGTPVRLRPVYEATAQADPNRSDALIDLGSIRGPLLLFAGTDDQMWQADTAAERIAGRLPTAEAHIYQGAGHVFELPGRYFGIYELGGTPEANAAAKEASDSVLLERLASWTGQVP